MPISKVIYGADTIIDITDTTAGATSVASGRYFYDSAGTKVEGIGSALGDEIVGLSAGGSAHFITGVDLTDDTVTASALMSGYTAHDRNGVAITGTASGGGIIPTGTIAIASNGVGIDVSSYASADVAVPAVLKNIIMRPDAELVTSVSYDKWAVADLELTLPSYSTSAQTLIASADLSPTISTPSFAEYMYYVVARFFAYPTYSVTTKAKGRVEFFVSSYLYELARQPLNTIHALLDPTKYLTSSIIAFSSMGFSRLVYYSSDTAISAYNSTSTGLYMTPVAPAYGSSTITLKSPTCGFKGSGTYFSSTYFGAMTDVRYQYIFEVYRAPVGNLNIDAWGTTQNINHIINCVNSTTKKLT